MAKAIAEQSNALSIFWLKNQIELRYEFSDGPNSQEKLDDIYNFIFEETLAQIILENSQGLSYTYNSLENKGAQDGRK
jgi:hypothetical protein